MEDAGREAQVQMTAFPLDCPSRGGIIYALRRTISEALMAIRTKCPYCKVSQRFEADFGDRVECGKCGKGIRLKSKADEFVEVEEVDPDKEGYGVGRVSGANAAAEITRAEMKKLKRKMDKDARLRRPSAAASAWQIWLEIDFILCVVLLSVSVLSFAVLMLTEVGSSAKFSAGATSFMCLIWLAKAIYKRLDR
jgi:ribosomal protein S27AE